MSRATEQRIKEFQGPYYLTEKEEEAAHLETIAFQMYGYKLIRRSKVGAFAKSAGCRWYDEINCKLARDKQDASKQLPAVSNYQKKVDFLKT